MREVKEFDCHQAILDRCRLILAPKANNATNDSNQPDERFRFAADSTSKKIVSRAFEIESSHRPVTPRSTPRLLAHTRRVPSAHARAA